MTATPADQFERYRLLVAEFDELFMPERDAAGETARRIDCGEGWYVLIRAFLECVRHLATVDQVRPPRILRIKEKLGTLRIQCLDAAPEIRSMIRITEAISEQVCEVCGALAASRIGCSESLSVRCIEHFGGIVPDIRLPSSG